MPPHDNQRCLSGVGARRGVNSRAVLMGAGSASQYYTLNSPVVVDIEVKLRTTSTSNTTRTVTDIANHYIPLLTCSDGRLAMTGVLINQQCDPA
ncbi:hypothetical protein E2C01_100692 [Portunus trituberculatus]|uniref:Uncharacterized protein n=1 Tax=Portunus trituberculatus TaxID=210409 RepID=A0A5B7KE83_PORTR|nr:hypothetical protein [Portunus trituberculatus]